MYNTAKEELKQALLNTSAVSPEALELLDELVNGGGGGGVLIVRENGSSIDKTYNEIRTAFLAGTPVILFYQYTYDDPTRGFTTNTIVSLTKIEKIIYAGTEGDTTLYYLIFDRFATYICTTPDDYPHLDA